MTVRTKAELKQYFLSRHKPTQSEFSDLIDSMALVGALGELGYITVGPAGSDADYICDGTADDVQIQAAIDELDALPAVIVYAPDGTPVAGHAGRGKAVVLRGSYSISATINLKGQHLVITEGAVLFPMADIDILNMQIDSCISGGGVITSAAYDTYSHALIKIYGTDKIFVGGNAKSMFIRDITLGGSVDHHATGIYFCADGFSTGEPDSECIYGITVDNVSMVNLLYGIRMEQYFFNWIAGNHFSNISINGVENAIYLFGDPSDGPWTNMFTNIDIEMGVSVPTGTAIRCSGMQNHFGPVMIWDVTVATGTAVNLTATSTNNRVIGRLETPIVNNGVGNVLDNYAL